MDKVNKKKPGRKRWFTKLGKVKKSDLTVGMVRIIVMFWLIPYLAISLVLLIYSQNRTDTEINDTITTSMNYSSKRVEVMLDSVIEQSRKASYDNVIKSSYSEYLKTKDEDVMHEKVIQYLNNTYKYSELITSAFIIYDFRTKYDYYTYSNIAGATFTSVKDFRTMASPHIRKAAKELDTGVKFVVAGGRVYLVRNIVNSKFEPIAIIALEVNTESLFSNMNSSMWVQNGIVFIDKYLVTEKGKEEDSGVHELEIYAKNNVLDNKVREGNVVAKYNKDNTIAYSVINVEGQKIAYIAKMDKVGIMNKRNEMVYVYIIIVILLLPLLGATFYFFYSNISKPIGYLMNASEKIEDGEYGYKIKEFKKNKEFGKLIETFNHMSTSLESSFKKIYAEEVAVRDANIKALQAQINPHFLNNTLEIINWKARMSGNDDVSGMIESLGIMMEATMNRNNESFITIREEMRYVNAYLYIINQRFGSKFKFTKNVDESLMDVKIPRLIVQPLVENMVDHGGDQYGNRVGKLTIFANANFIFIKVENNGNIDEKSMKKIKELLSETEIGGQSKSIGIRNVNLRLKLLYGDKSGLTITNTEENVTISEIVIEKKHM